MNLSSTASGSSSNVSGDRPYFLNHFDKIHSNDNLTFNQAGSGTQLTALSGNYPTGGNEVSSNFGGSSAAMASASGPENKQLYPKLSGGSAIGIQTNVQSPQQNLSYNAAMAHEIQPESQSRFVRSFVDGDFEFVSDFLLFV